jgi:hypothetical protein
MLVPSRRNLHEHDSWLIIGQLFSCFAKGIPNRPGVEIRSLNFALGVATNVKAVGINDIHVVVGAGHTCRLHITEQNMMPEKHPAKVELRICGLNVPLPHPVKAIVKALDELKVVEQLGQVDQPISRQVKSRLTWLDSSMVTNPGLRWLGIT